MRLFVLFGSSEGWGNAGIFLHGAQLEDLLQIHFDLESER